MRWADRKGRGAARCSVRWPCSRRCGAPGGSGAAAEDLLRSRPPGAARAARARAHGARAGSGCCGSRSPGQPWTRRRCRGTSTGALRRPDRRRRRARDPDPSRLRQRPHLGRAARRTARRSAIGSRRAAPLSLDGLADLPRADGRHRYGPEGTFWAEHPEIPAKPIRAWQIWNEQNSPQYFGPGRPDQIYAKLVTEASRAIKVEDPNADVVLGGMFISPSGKNEFRILHRAISRRLYASPGFERALRRGRESTRTPAG